MEVVPTGAWSPDTRLLSIVSEGDNNFLLTDIDQLIPAHTPAPPVDPHGSPRHRVSPRLRAVAAAVPPPVAIPSSPSSVGTAGPARATALTTDDLRSLSPEEAVAEEDFRHPRELGLATPNLPFSGHRSPATASVSPPLRPLGRRPSGTPNEPSQAEDLPFSMVDALEDDDLTLVTTPNTDALVSAALTHGGLRRPRQPSSRAPTSASPSPRGSRRVMTQSPRGSVRSARQPSKGPRGSQATPASPQASLCRVTSISSRLSESLEGSVSGHAPSRGGSLTRSMSRSTRQRVVASAPAPSFPVPGMSKDDAMARDIERRLASSSPRYVGSPRREGSALRSSATPALTLPQFNDKSNGRDGLESTAQSPGSVQNASFLLVPPGACRTSSNLSTFLQCASNISSRRGSGTTASLGGTTRDAGSLPPTSPLASRQSGRGVSRGSSSSGAMHLGAGVASPRPPMSPRHSESRRRLQATPGSHRQSRLDEQRPCEALSGDALRFSGSTPTSIALSPPPGVPSQAPSQAPSSRHSQSPFKPGSIASLIAGGQSPPLSPGLSPGVSLRNTSFPRRPRPPSQSVSQSASPVASPRRSPVGPRYGRPTRADSVSLEVHMDYSPEFIHELRESAAKAQGPAFTQSTAASKSRDAKRAARLAKASSALEDSRRFRPCESSFFCDSDSDDGCSGSMLPTTDQTLQLDSLPFELAEELLHEIGLMLPPIDTCAAFSEEQRQITAEAHAVRRASEGLFHRSTVGAPPTATTSPLGSHSTTATTTTTAHDAMLRAMERYTMPEDSFDVVDLPALPAPSLPPASVAPDSADLVKADSEASASRFPMQRAKEREARSAQRWGYIDDLCLDTANGPMPSCKPVPRVHTSM